MEPRTVAMKQTTGYRADIQGLRAIAVLLVVTFHAGLPLVGGFIGVDVFFVISGYVITSMLLREWHANGTIRLRRFWRRRFFRLTPALAVLVVIVFILTALILLPLQQRIAYQTGLGALFFVANIVIARNTGGYFDGPAEQNPLLNTWSLSVEEQFYFLFPFILVGALALTRKTRRLSWLPIAAIGGIALVSIIFMWWSLSPDGQSVTWLNFYSPITRSWEFAVGSLISIASWGRPAVGTGIGRLLRLAGGVGLIAGALLITGETPFPSQWTLLPVLATAALLIGGESPSNGRQRVLENPVLVKIGDWSYSIYLWHWPFIVFAIALGITTVPLLVLVALLSVIPAYLSYRFIETPLRRWQPARIKSRVFAASGLLLGPVVLVPLLITTATPSPRFQGTVGTQYIETIWATSYSCSLTQLPNSGSRCFQSKEGEPLGVVVIGDSHAEDLYLGLQRNLPDVNVGYVYLPDWPYGSSDNARNTFRQIADSASIHTVIVNARWDEGGADSDEVATELATLNATGKAIFLADDRPTFTFHAEKCQFQPFISVGTRCEEPSERFLANYGQYRPTLEGLASQFESVSLLNTAEGICNETSCSMIEGDVLLYADSGHLNEVGSERVIARLLKTDPVFREAAKSGA